jgi:hypothetical protein
MTGPFGSGPMTGRRMGNCAGTNNTGSGFGFGRGFFTKGRGQGRGFGFFGQSSDPDFNEGVIQNEIKSIKSRLSYFENLLRKDKPGE